MKQITSAGGTITTFDSKRVFTHVFLLTIRPCRTLNYLYALAKRIPVLSFRWITECLKQNSITHYESFRLSNGWSDQIFHFSNAQYNENGVFRNVKVCVLESATGDFKKGWEMVLKAGNCTLSDFEEAEFVVGDENSVKREGAVGTEWIVQSLIVQKVLKGDKYRL